MKPHFGQSDAAMNKLAGINQLPNNNKPPDLLKLMRDVPCSCIPCKHYETPIDEIPCKYCRDHTKFEENYVLGSTKKTPKRISPISYENGFEDGYEKAKKEYSVSMSGEMYVTEENMTPEPLPEGYYGHELGCDCAVCEDMHNTELRRKIVDAEWNKLMDDHQRLTVLLDAEQKNVVYAQQKWGEAEERDEKWKTWYESVSGDAAKYRKALEQIAIQPLEPAHIYEIADRIKLIAKVALEI